MKGPRENIAGMVADLQDLPSYLDEHLRRDLNGEVPLGLQPYVDLLRNPARAYEKIIQLLGEDRLADAQALYDFLLNLFEEAYKCGIIDDRYFRFVSKEQFRAAYAELERCRGENIWEIQKATWAGAHNAGQFLS